MEKEVKAKLLSTLTEPELERIKLQRAYEELKPGSLSRKIAILNDHVRRNIVKSKSEIDKMPWDIKNIHTKRDRIKVQVVSGIITDEIRPGLLMNMDELKVELDHSENVSRSIAMDLVTRLFEIRRFVGLHDPDNKIVLTEEQFDAYAQTVIDKAKVLGYDILDQ